MGEGRPCGMSMREPAPPRSRPAQVLQRGLGAGADVHLLVDVPDVRPHRVDRDEQLVADLAVAVALSEEAEDLLFARREGVLVIGYEGGTVERLDDAAGDPARHR